MKWKYFRLKNLLEMSTHTSEVCVMYNLKRVCFFVHARIEYSIFIWWYLAATIYSITRNNCCSAGFNIYWKLYSSRKRGAFVIVYTCFVKKIIFALHTYEPPSLRNERPDQICQPKNFIIKMVYIIMCHLQWGKAERYIKLTDRPHHKHIHSFPRIREWFGDLHQKSSTFY